MKTYQKIKLYEKSKKNEMFNILSPQNVCIYLI